MKRCMLIGGAGFLGSNLVRRLQETPGVEKILVYDNLRTTGTWELVPKLQDVHLVEGNARDLDYLRTTMRDFAPDTVFHLAANPDIARAATEPTIDFEQGTILTQNVLEAMRLCGVKRLLYTSGSGVYGEADETFREDFGPMMPISTYGASKLASEALICAYCHMFDMTARAFRFANIVGPRQTHGVGYDFLRKLKADRTTLKILGDGSQTKSYVHVDDALSAVFLANAKMTDDIGIERCYDVLNVGTQDTLTVTQIAEMAVLASGIQPRTVLFDYSGGDRGWKGDVPNIRFNCAKIRALGWQPKYSARDALLLSLMAMAENLP